MYSAIFNRKLSGIAKLRSIPPRNNPVNVVFNQLIEPVHEIEFFAWAGRKLDLEIAFTVRESGVGIAVSTTVGKQTNMG